MRAIRAGLLCSLLAARAPAGEPVQPSFERPDSETVVERAVRCAERGRRAVAGYVALHRKRVAQAGLRGRAGREQTFLYRVRPAADEPAYELLEVDGRPATAADFEREERLRERFRSHVGAGRDSGAEGLRGFEMSRPALGRYRFGPPAEDRAGGRRVWRMTFEPRPGRLPVERRLDEALNRSAGTMWIDAEDFGLVAVEFALREPYRVWAGLLGSLSRMEGRFEQVRVRPGVWAPKSMHLKLSGRALAESLNQVVELEWTDYRPAPAAP